jgi:transcription initiation factor IIF auxiliary subunit
MGIQESINSALGTASTIASKVAPDKAQEKTGLKARTADFRNYDKNMADKSAQSLKREIQGKKAQTERIKQRKKTLKENVLQINTDPRIKEVL